MHTYTHKHTYSSFLLKSKKISIAYTYDYLVEYGFEDPNNFNFDLNKHVVSLLACKCKYMFNKKISISNILKFTLLNKVRNIVIQNKFKINI